MTLAWVRAGAATVVLLTSGSGLAQTATTPRMGFVEDRAARRLHAIFGIPGAAHVGPVLELGDLVVPEAVSARGNYVLIVTGKGRKPGLWLPRAKSVQPLESAAPGPDGVVLSPEGTAAALYYRGENLILTISGLPDAPTPPVSMHLNPLGSSIREMAVSDDGTLVLVMPAGDAESPGTREPSALVFSAAGTVNRIWLSGPARAIAFGSHSHDAVVAGVSEARLIREVDRPIKEVQLPAENLGSISAAAIAPGGQQVLLAAPEAAQAVIVKLETAELSYTAVPCQCVPTELARISGESGYRLTPYSGGVSWMLDISSRMPRILSVPPVTPEVEP